MSIVAFGLLTLDHVLTVDAVPGPNEKIVARHSALDVGGPAANAAATARALGSEVTLVTAVGSSALTDVAVAGLAELGVPVVDLLARSSGSPAVSTVLVDAVTGDRAVVSVNASDVGPVGEVPAAVLGSAAVLLVDGHHMEAAIDAARRARAMGVTVVFDGGSWKEGTDRLVEHVDVALVSADFAVPDGSDPIPFLRRAGCAVAARSNGAGPIIGSHRGHGFSIPVDESDAVDTLGAGDVLHGALSHYLAEAAGELDHVPSLLRAASVVATASVSATGARGWTASAEEVAAAAEVQRRNGGAWPEASS